MCGKSFFLYIHIEGGGSMPDGVMFKTVTLSGEPSHGLNLTGRSQTLKVNVTLSYLVIVNKNDPYLLEGKAVCFIMSDTYCSQFQYIYYLPYMLL